MPKERTTTATLWARETQRLLADFKRDFERQQGSGTAKGLDEAMLLMASDFLQRRFGDDAHWDRLDITELLDDQKSSATDPAFVQRLVTVLGAFYCYLGNIGRSAPEVHARMRQLCLDALLLGPDVARERFRAETQSRCVTQPMWRLARPSPAA